MKIRKLLCIIMVICTVFSLFACNKKNKDDGKNDPNVGTTDNNSKVVYVYSVNSKSIHLPTCHFAQTIKEDYRKETTDLMALLDKEYELCKFCFPVEKEEPEEEEEEEEEIIQKVPYEDATYILNNKTFKIHEKGCQHLETLSAKNTENTDLSYEELLVLEYSPCGTCMPAEYKEYKKDHPDEK